MKKKALKRDAVVKDGAKKRKRSMVVILAATLAFNVILCGCGEKKGSGYDQGNSSDQVYKEIDLKSMHWENTVLVKEVSTFSKYKTSREEFEYNDLGWPIKMLSYQTDENGTEKLETYAMDYDGSGRLLLMKCWDKDQKILAWYECEYDDLGNVRIEKYKNANGSINKRYEYKYEYDEQGNVKEEKCFKFKGNKKKGYMCHYKTFDTGSLIQFAEYYDKKGKVSKRVEYNQGEITKWTEYDKKGKVDYCREVEFDAQGREVKETDTSKEKCEYDQYEYNDAGNLIKKTHYVNGELTRTVEWKYDAHNNLLKYEVIIEARDELEIQEMKQKRGKKYIELYEYDSAGNNTKIVGRRITDSYLNSELRNTKEESYSKEYEYDDQGNMIKKTYNENEKVKNITEHEYDDQGEKLKTRYFQYGYDGEIFQLSESTYDGKGHYIGNEKYEYHENGDMEKIESDKIELIEKPVMVNDNIRQNWLDGEIFRGPILLKLDCIDICEDKKDYD